MAPTPSRPSNDSRGGSARGRGNDRGRGDTSSGRGRGNPYDGMFSGRGDTNRRARARGGPYPGNLSGCGDTNRERGFGEHGSSGGWGDANRHRTGFGQYYGSSGGRGRGEDSIPERDQGASSSAAAAASSTPSSFPSGSSPTGLAIPQQGALLQQGAKRAPPENNASATTKRPKVDGDAQKGSQTERVNPGLSRLDRFFGRTSPMPMPPPSSAAPRTTFGFERLPPAPSAAPMTGEVASSTAEATVGSSPEKKHMAADNDVVAPAIGAVASQATHIAFPTEELPLTAESVAAAEITTAVGPPAESVPVKVDTEDEFNEQTGHVPCADEDNNPSMFGVTSATDQAQSPPRVVGMICDIIKNRGPSFLETLTGVVAEKLSTDGDNDWADTDTISRIISTALNSNPAVFELITSDMMFRWRLVPGPGRSTDSATVEVALGSKGHVLTPQRCDFDFGELTLAIVRCSRDLRERETKEEYRQLAETLMDVYHRDRAPGEQRPPTHDISDPPTFDGRVCVRFFIQQHGSREALSGPDVTWLIAANDLALQRGRPMRVKILGCGWDGLSTESVSFALMRQIYPGLDFSISLLVERGAAPPPDVAALHRFDEPGRSWADYDVLALQTLFDRGDIRSIPSVTFAHHEQFLLILRICNDNNVIQDDRASLTDLQLPFTLLMADGRMANALLSERYQLLRAMVIGG